jgi:hypothetical protein
MRGGEGGGAEGVGAAAGAGCATGGTSAGEAGGASATVAALGARSAAPCGARNTAPAAEFGGASEGRGGRLLAPPLRLDGAGPERGALFAALFGAVLAGRGALEEARGVASTDSMAAIRSAWVMPDMSTAGTPGAEGCVEAPALTDNGAAAGADAADEEATSPLVAGSAGSALAASVGAAVVGAFAVESGVLSGALRTT